MKWNVTRSAAILALLASAPWHVADAQAPREAIAEQSAATRRGPRGGTLKQVGALQFETLVEQGGVEIRLLGDKGQPLEIAKARGIVTLRVQGAGKRYRYDLLPNGKDALAAPVNLTKIAGRQIELDVQLVGLTGAERQPIRFQEVATVPATPQQLAAAAIARQKVCPVSGKPLGSMGQPVAVTVDGQTVYACCEGCVNAIEANPEKYAAVRPLVMVTAAVEDDQPLIARQGMCPVMNEPLGSMGPPIKVLVGNKPVFLCCKGCIKTIKADPAKYLAMVYGDRPATAGATPAGGEQVRPGVFRTTAADAPFVAAQKKCPVMDEPLDAMGGPYRVSAGGKAIYICCPGCAKKIAADPQKYLAILAEQGVTAPVIR